MYNADTGISVGGRVVNTICMYADVKAVVVDMTTKNRVCAGVPQMSADDSIPNFCVTLFRLSRSCCSLF